jgi:glycerol kinase
MQFQSNVLQCKVIRPNITETTALGAAYLAGLAIGFWENIDDIKNQWQVEKEFSPQKNQEEIKQLVDGWNKAISATLHVAT